jgi:hypothetical protein
MSTITMHVKYIFSYVEYEDDYARCSCLKRLHVSSLPSTPLFVSFPVTVNSCFAEYHINLISI